MKNLQLFCFSALYLLSTVSFAARAQEKAIGIFTDEKDIGIGTKPGSSTYIFKNQQYVISGSGHNIWSDHDEFHFVYKKLKGDFIFYTRAEFVGWDGVEEHRKIGLMIRKSLEANSEQVSAVVHGDGLTSLQFRRNQGSQTEEIKSKTEHANIIQLERTGDVITMRVAKAGAMFVIEQIKGLKIGEEVYVGLFVGSHHPDVTETAVFRDVKITVPYPGLANQNTQMTLGSDLEIMEVATGNRKVIYSVPYSIQAPNWTPDGKKLIFNDNKGLMYKFDLASGKRELLNTAGVNNNNNDHVLSFDGKMIGLSSNVSNLGGSIVYTVPVIGGVPLQITPNGPSYLHGWSPDGKELVFCGERDGEFDVYKIPAVGGAEVRLTNTKGLDDGPEYTPDGKYIYFNSVRSGLMQIWRMKPDGSEQEQITNDDFNNWFAHISPDGKWMVYLTFLKEEVEPNAHPPYQHVYIRLSPLAGGKSKVLAYLYGGQGSINTPSWSPDSKHIAFISNTKPN